jgi:hypothetical protein
MVNIPQSNRVKSRAIMEDRVSAIRQAHKAYLEEQLKPVVAGIKKKSLRAIAAEYDVPVQTLSDRVSGKHADALEAFESRQLLNPQQERSLVELIQVLDEGAFPVNRSDIEGYANSILNRGHRGGDRSVGKRWVD